ncbi:MAG: hypothetical protein JW787_18015 [Sedimentisphaerales bacterium]|nr:hypothetical protein [Sedimentisphaerales bacterium]
MNRMLKIKIGLCVLFLMVISVGFIFASDVTVQQGTMTVDGDLEVGGSITGGDISGTDLTITDGYYDYLYFNHNNYYMATDEDYGFLCGGLGVGNSQDGYLSVWVDGYSSYLYNSSAIIFSDTLGVFPNEYLVYIDQDLVLTGKIDSVGGYDPPYVLYDQKTRSEIIDQVKKEVSPDKQGGATMFFNKETKKIETYVASEGKFYDLDGKVVQELAEVVQPTTRYETAYHFDSTTGQVREILRPVAEKYQIRKEYSLDKKTGKFVKKATGDIVSREEALEIYVASEGKIYDLQHNFVRNAEMEKPSAVAAAGNSTDSSVQINTAQNSDEKQEIKIKPASLN